MTTSQMDTLKVELHALLAKQGFQRDRYDNEKLGEYRFKFGTGTLRFERQIAPGNWMMVRSWYYGQIKDEELARCIQRAVEEGKGTEALAAAGAAITRNTEHDGIEVRFPSKPSREVIDRMKDADFRWSQRQGLWYRRYNEAAWDEIHQILGVVNLKDAAVV